MKRFQFRLQSVLEHRERRENQAIQSYAEAKQAIKEAETVLCDLLQLRRDLINGLSELRRLGNIDPREQVVYQDYIKQSRLDIARQEEYVCELSTMADKLQLKLVDASQDKHVIDTMKSKCIEEHKYLSQRREQEDADEMAAMRHLFKRGMDKAA